MVDEETEEDFVSDILQEVVSSALDQIYYKIIEQRIIPYTVNAAKDLLLEVIEVGSSEFLLGLNNIWPIPCHICHDTGSMFLLLK